MPRQRSRKKSRSVSSEASISAKHAPQPRLSLEVNNSDGETVGSRKVKEAKKVPRQRSRKKSVSPEAGISAKHTPQPRLSLKTNNSDGETAVSRKVKEAKKVPRQRSRKKSVSPEAGISVKHAPQPQLSLKTNNSSQHKCPSYKLKKDDKLTRETSRTEHKTALRKRGREREAIETNARVDHNTHVRDKKGEPKVEKGNQRSRVSRSTRLKQVKDNGVKFTAWQDRVAVAQQQDDKIGQHDQIFSKALEFEPRVTRSMKKYKETIVNLREGATSTPVKGADNTKCSVDDGEIPKKSTLAEFSEITDKLPLNLSEIHDLSDIIDGSLLEQSAPIVIDSK